MHLPKSVIRIIILSLFLHFVFIAAANHYENSKLEPFLANGSLINKISINALEYARATDVQFIMQKGVDTLPSEEVIRKAKLNKTFDLVNLVADNAGENVQAITANDGITHYWSFKNKGDSLRSYKIWYYKGERLYLESYVTYHDTLIHAMQEEKYIPVNHFIQQRWYCALFLDNGKVFYMTSLGHGKTEDDSWDAEAEILGLYKLRMHEASTLIE